MSAIARWVGKHWPRLQTMPTWGVEPVPEKDRRLGFLDYFVLWIDLGVGLLVLLAGSFLVPGLGLGRALLVILIGTAIGSLLLALTGVIAARTGAPTMVLLRAPLGRRGSYLPTLLNILQLVGWTIFEIIIMGHAANTISQALFAFDSYPFWTAFFTLAVILMALGGPLTVVRYWLEKFAIWVVLVTSAYLTGYIFANYDLGELTRRPGDGSLPFWVAVDLVIAMPVSWLPLVADYNRFARREGPAFWGTFLGYFASNAWFYALGAVLLLAAGLPQEPKGFVAAVSLIAGWLALLILLVHETDNAWADLYSTAVSVQNAFPKVSQRGLIIGLGLFAYLVALVLDLTRYELFLFLIGSFFVPLFGILLADYFVLRRKYDPAGLYTPGGFQPLAILAWLVGVLAYHLTSPSTLGLTLLPGWGQGLPAWLTAWGGSLPAFIVSFGLHWLAGRLSSRREAESI